MANTKSAKKRVKQNEKRRIRNRSTRSKVKTSLKKVEHSVKNNDGDTKALATNCISALDKACKRGVYHKNFVARKKSKLMKTINLNQDKRV